MIRPAALALLVALGACGGGGERPATPAAGAADWRRIATAADRARLRGWRTAWTAALAKAADGGHLAKLRAEGALLQPDAALPDPIPPAGDYRCRVTKLGAKQPGMADFLAYPAFDCRVAEEGGVRRFAKLTGSQRPVGTILADGQTRAIFLGTMMLGDEARALDYGRDRARDVAGLVERIGTARWRLVLPYPHWESMLDVVELVPAGG